MLYAGGVAGQISVEDRVSGLDTRSDYQLGWELGGGAEYDLDERWSLKPQLRYRLLPGSFESGNVSFEESLRYLAISVSISYQL
jgi:opacity protein-like surface antigen